MTLIDPGVWLCLPTDERRFVFFRPNQGVALVGTGWPCEDVDMATRDLDRLAKYVKAHRMEQYPSRDAAAAAAGVVRNTWKRVEEGQPVYESTYAKIDRALGWATGSCVAIAEGGEPVFVGQSTATAEVAPKTLTAGEARQMAWDAARETLPTAPIGELDAFAAELVEKLRRAGVVADDS